MSRTRWAVGAAAAALVAGTALAAGGSSARVEPSETSKQETAKQKTDKDLRTVTVTVKKVDPKSHKVTFEAIVTPEATNSSGRPVKLDQLKEGDQVRAAFDPKTGEVVRVDLTPGHGKAKTH